MNCYDLKDIITRGNDLYNSDSYNELGFCEKQDVDNGYICHAFTYGNSLRFQIMCQRDATDEYIAEIIKFIYNVKKKYELALTLLWYGQVNGFSTKLLETLPQKGEIFRFIELYFDRTLKLNILDDMKGLEVRKYKSNMLEDSIDILESAFTPQWDTEGSYKQDRERLAKIFEDTDNCGCLLLFLQDKPIGLYCYNKGQVEFIGIKKGYQGNGYGNVLMSCLLQDMLNNSHYEPHLTPASENKRAIHLYEKFGFRKLCENSRVTLNF
jgi:ribosomal protein S18 acetylase RimI-like enzyme